MPRGRLAIRVVLTALSLASYQTASAANGLCKPLQAFVASVKPGETKVLEFHASWGSDFKDSADDKELVFAAKRCDPHNYEPAKAVCSYLLEHGATEFSGNNAKTAVMCLSPNTHFGRMELDGIVISLTHGTDNRGSNVDIRFAPDEQLGGMVLSITARGY